ncbi:hypothetical protein TSUD_372550 [Trifolium subterraneum]|uniref:Disease resistance protein At4g27190-like leucine-rich repeats domain-containing protein n=1 Tax=Trifolium subterraneum TaxID=3900 RepID=A0A2Z6M8P5_TRISU|nr:hypothetical protein TSUD_372550 [Trifolium subterraneum]
MADVAISIVASLVERLVGPAIREGKCFLCVNKVIGDLENEKKELVIERDNLLDRVEQAKHRTEEIEKSVEMWLNDVKNLLEQVEDLEQMMRANTSCFQGQRRKSFDLSRATFQGVKGLKVFSLIYNGYGDPSLSLPSSTHSLTNLRTLRLNGWKLDNILFITNLTRLEILDLQHCILNELPKQIGKLNRLKLLDLSYCRFLQENYNAAIGKLSKLEELYAFKCMPKEYIYQCAMDIITLPRLQRFVIHTDLSRDFAKTSRHLEVMDFNISNMKASTKNLLQIAETIHLINLHGGCKSVMPDLIGVMGGVSCFKSLCLEGCPEIEYIFNIASDPKLECLVPELVELVLLRLENLEELCRGPPLNVLSFFERLEKLEIQQCLKLHNIFPWDCNLRNLKVLKIANSVFGEALFSISVAHSLQQLEVLEIEHCDELKHIIATGHELGSNSDNEIFQTPLKSSHFIMSRLKKLHIYKCKKLESLLPICCVEGLAPLEEIQIKKAPQLKLVFGECDHQNHSCQQYPNQNLHPYLKRLKLTDLDNLIGICPEINCEKWPSSTVLIVENCPKLSASWIATLAGSEDREKVVKIEKMTLRGFSGLSLISRVDLSTKGFETLFPDLNAIRSGCLNSLPLDLGDFVPLESSNIIKNIDLVNQKSGGYLLDSENLNNKCEDVQHVDGDGNYDDNKKSGNGVKGYLDSSCVEVSREQFNFSQTETGIGIRNALSNPNHFYSYALPCFDTGMGTLLKLLSGITLPADKETLQSILDMAETLFYSIYFQ